MRTLPLLVPLLALASAPTACAAELVSGAVPFGFTGGTSVLRGISDDASAVLYESDGNPVVPPGWIFGPEAGVYLRDRLAFTTRLVLPYWDHAVGSAEATLSGDGRVVAYLGVAYLPGTIEQVHTITLASGVDALASTSSLGVPADRRAHQPAISGDGVSVAFTSEADNLTADGLPGVLVADIFVKNRVTGLTTCASLTPDGRADTGDCALPALSRNGRWVAFYSGSAELVPGTPRGFVRGVFARDLVAGATVRVDVASDGTPANTSPYDIYPPAVSSDGRFVAFASAASNLVAGDGNGQIDIFVRDLRDGVTTRASVSTLGAEGDDASLEPSLSLDGRYVAFRSYASTLVGGDTNGAVDVFVRDRTAGTTIRVDNGWAGLQANDDARPGTRICGLGFAVAYTSVASNLVGGDTNGKSDVFLNANDPRFGASSPAALYFSTLIAWVRLHLRDLIALQPRANG